MRINIISLITLLSIIMMSKNVSGQIKTRSLAELTSDTSGWGVVLKSAKSAKNKIEILPIDQTKVGEALFQTQVTTHSCIGAIIYFTGGILIDNGWIRILGSGNDRLSRSLPLWNKGKTFKEFGDQINYLLVADDVLGGFFAINGGALGNDKGNIYYLAPDTLE